MASTRRARCRASSRSSTDVTEQRAAERALRESEARFRRIANSAPVMMWVTRLDRTRDFVNDAYAEFVGGTARGGRGRSTGGRGSTPTTSSGSSPRASPARRARKPFTLEGRYRRARRRVSLAAERVVAALRARRRAGRLHRRRQRHHSGQGSGARIEGARSRSGPPSWRTARRSSGRSSRRCSKCWCCSSPTAPSSS